MSGWLLGIVGVVFAGVIIETIMPTGKTKDIIRCVFAIFTVYVIISPLPQLFSKDFTLNTETASTEIDTGYLYKNNQQIVSAAEKELKNRIEEVGYCGVNVVIWANLFASPIKIQKVYIDLTNVVLSEEVKHINKYSTLTDLVLQYVDVEKEDIIFYG